MHPTMDVDVPVEDLPPLINSSTRAAVKNLTKLEIATSLWKTKDFVGLGSAGMVICSRYI